MRVKTMKVAWRPDGDIEKKKKRINSAAKKKRNVFFGYNRVGPENKILP